MAASNSSDDRPSSPDPQPERARLARPATAPSRPAASDGPPAGAPRLPRPFVPRGARAAPAAPLADRPPGGEPPRSRETGRAPDAAADTRPDRPTEPLAAVDATPATAGEEGGWDPAAAPTTPDERAALDALAGEPGVQSPSVVPGADARPRPATPVVPAEAVALAPSAPEADSAVETEWLAMRELGAAAPPAADTAADARTGQSEAPRAYADLTATVIPPAEAWPEDVWSEDSAPAAEPGTLRDDASPHPVVFGNDLMPAADEDQTLGSRSVEPPATVYPPAVPDAVDAYALDGDVVDLGSSSAVYTPDRAHEWTVSAGGMAAEGGMPVPPPAVRPEVSPPREPRSPEVAARLRSLADAVENGELDVPALEAGMRDSEALVVLLAALLRSGR